MDHDANATQGRPPGCGVHTRSEAAPGKCPWSRAKKSTPSGSRGPRAPASAAKTTPSGVTDAETTGAQGAAGAKVCTPEPINLEGLGKPVRTRRAESAGITVRVARGIFERHVCGRRLGKGRVVARAVAVMLGYFFLLRPGELFSLQWSAVRLASRSGYLTWVPALPP